MPYLWALYKEGALVDIHELLSVEGLTTEGFRRNMHAFLASEHGELAMTKDRGLDVVNITAYAVLLEGVRKPGKIELAALIMGQARPTKLYLNIETIVFVPWASPRARYQALTAFIGWLKLHRVAGFAVVPDQHKRMWDSLTKMLLMRKVGTSHSCLLYTSPSPRDPE